MPSEQESEVANFAYLNIYVGGDLVERLALQEGESFEAEVHADDYRLELQEVKTVE